MKKADITTGAVYAYQQNKYASPVPAVILSTELYSGRDRYTRNGPLIHKARAGAKPGTSYTGQSTGYPAVLLRWDAAANEDLIQQMQAVRLADIEKATSDIIRDGLAFCIVTRLAAVIGPYGEVMAELDAARRAGREQAQRERQAEEASRARAIDIITALSVHDITANRIAAYGAVGSVSIPLGEAEKLVRLLRQDG